MKENEELLRDKVNKLQSQVYQITMYLEEQKRLIDNMAPPIGAYSHTFYHQQQVQLGFITQEQSISVYIEVAPGSHKQVHPIITQTENQTQLDFDMPYTGYAIIGEPFVSDTLVLPDTPYMEPYNEIILLVEPEPEEPIIRTGIHDTWQQ